MDYNYDSGNRKQIVEGRDIGMILTCLEECDQRGTDCLSVTLQNERGGRQRCFVHDASAVVDQTDPVSETGVTYFEKICVEKKSKFENEITVRVVEKFFQCVIPNFIIDD